MEQLDWTLKQIQNFDSHGLCILKLLRRHLILQVCTFFSSISPLASKRSMSQKYTGIASPVPTEWCWSFFRTFLWSQCCCRATMYFLRLDFLFILPWHPWRWPWAKSLFLKVKWTWGYSVQYLVASNGRMGVPLVTKFFIKVPPKFFWWINESNVRRQQDFIPATKLVSGGWKR